MRAQRTATVPLLVLVLLLVPSTLALGGDFRDTRDDAEAPHDLRLLHWDVTDRSATVVLVLGDAHDDQAAYTAILFLGTEGGAEPREWYVVHTGPGGASVLAGHAEDPETGVVRQAQNGTLAFTFDRVEPTGSPCAFMVAQSSIHDGEGRQVKDSAPSRNTDLETAWDLGAYCAGMPQETVPAAGPGGDSNGTSAPGPALLALGLFGLAFARRRR